MELTVDYLRLKITQFEEAALRFERDAIANRGAAEGLKNILASLDEEKPKDNLPIIEGEIVPKGEK